MIDDTNRNWQWKDNGSILENVQKSTATTHHERREAVREYTKKWLAVLHKVAATPLANNYRQVHN